MGYGMGMVKGLVYMAFGVVGMVVVVSCYLIYYVWGGVWSMWYVMQLIGVWGKGKVCVFANGFSIIL